MGTAPIPSSRRVDRFLEMVERVGNRLPDPALLFVGALVITWIASALLSSVAFETIDPRTGSAIAIQNQLEGAALASFLARMVEIFVTFPPLGVVLVALLGVGVAEHTGFIGASLRAMLGVTPARLLTPMLILVAIVSHTAADAGYVLVIPLGGVIFAAAGRHPLAGIAAAFAGVSGGFGANFIPSGIDPLLQGFTQSAAQIIDPSRTVNPLSNWWFAAASSLLIVLVGWYVTDKIVEPRLAKQPVETGDEGLSMGRLSQAEVKGLWAGGLALLAGVVFLVAASWGAQSPMRAPDGDLTGMSAPLMRAIVPLIFLLFLFPGVVYGYVAGTVRSHKDVIEGMSKSMGTMGYYLVLAFFASLFTAAFAASNLGALVALQGAAFIQALSLPGGVTIVGIIAIIASVNLLIGSASAKWALLGPVFVPMLMQLGISPELTQAAYRVGDSTTNIISPLMPYFPLVVVYCQRYQKRTGIGTLVSTMLPYTLAFFGLWVAFLLIYWGLGLPLGIQSTYTYP
jgi:aminobenzoyl-glutamate transport protein